MKELEPTPEQIAQYEEDLLSCSEFAVLVGRSERSIQRYLKTRKLTGLDTLMGTRIHRSEIHKFIPDRLHRQSPAENDSSRQVATDSDKWTGQVASDNDKKRQVPPESVISRQLPTESDIGKTTASDNWRQNPTDNDNSRQGQSNPQPVGIPVEVHLEALKGIQEALRQVEQQHQALLEERRRVELAERQKLALENELSSYRRALSETAESLHEVRARAAAAEARLQGEPHECLPVADVFPSSAPAVVKLDTPKPSSGKWGSRFKRWLLGEKTG